MSQVIESPSTPWMEQWLRYRVELVGLLRSMGYVPADQRGTRRDNAESYPHISILRDRTKSASEKLFGVLTASWIGTVFFPASSENSIVIEVFGERNLAEARYIAWQLNLKTSVNIEARLAHPQERTEVADVPHVSNVENWGDTF